MTLIERFLQQYSREYDFYQELSRLSATRIEDQLIKQGIKAIVTHRAKRPDRLQDKLQKRNAKNPYKSKEDMLRDIVDLAGVRVSLYFPSARNVIDEVISKLFLVGKKKEFPDAAHTPKYEKRFSGYWATHYRVTLKDDGANARYLNTPVEVQVASVLMHAWAEVEHDLVYKPSSGELSKNELSILDEINGLVITGEIALERLHAAISERTSKKKEITDKYELMNYLFHNISKTQLKDLKLGDTRLLSDYLLSFDKINTKKFRYYMNNIDLKSHDSISNQIVFSLLDDNYDDIKHKLRSYLVPFPVSPKKASIFEKFIRTWIILEKAQRTLLKQSKTFKHRYLALDVQYLKAEGIVTDAEVTEFDQLRKIRNEVLHGVEVHCDEVLQEKLKSLEAITRKVIKAIADWEPRGQLNQELSEL